MFNSFMPKTSNYHRSSNKSLNLSIFQTWSHQHCQKVNQNMLFSITMYYYYIIRMDLFTLCLCKGSSTSKKATLDSTSKYYTQIQNTLSNNEQVIIQLIYHDLASRHHNNLLTFEHFLLFFGLTGLWGAKLFRQFDESGRKLITKQQFFVGLSRTTKAPHEQKICQLFNFFKDKEDNGIKYIDFTKMLYNYSRDELKEIIMEDRCMISQLNKNLTQVENDYPLHHSTQSSIRQYLQSSRKHSRKIIELNYEQPNQSQNQTCFQKHYSKFSEYKDPGTIFQLKLNDLTYKINYCNMITLVKEFAKRTYKCYQIDTKTGIFTLDQFTLWIQSHNKLFQSYYTSFHIDIWSYCGSEPNFINKIQRSFTGSIKIENKVLPIYAMLVEDVLIIAQSHKKRQFPFKVIFLQGLTMRQIKDINGYGIQISHRDQYYEKCSIFFKQQDKIYEYLECFSIYAGQTLHDLYYSHQVIGTGTFSIVYRCTEKQTGRSFALKDMSTEKLTKDAIAMLNNESQIMKIISHPQIVKYQQTIRSKAHIYIIAQYIYGKDLFTFVTKRKHLSEYISAFIIGKIIEATIYLHSLQIMHRDLKPQNIMVILRENTVSADCSYHQSISQQQLIQNVKIIDFGFANHLSQLKSMQRHAITGTPNYIAPEIIKDDPPTLKSDNFSIGAILYFLLSGKLAFALQSMQFTLLLTVKGQYDLQNGIWQSVSPQAKDLIRRMLEPDPKNRIQLEDALNHPWFEVAKRQVALKTVEQAQSSSQDCLSNNQIAKVQEIVLGEDSNKKKMSRL